MATKKTKERISYKDVGIQYLTKGLESVKKDIVSGKIPLAIARRAADHLKQQGVKDLLSAFLDKHAPKNGKGKAPPTVGSERDYIAQALKDEGAYIRLPIGPLGLKKGQKTHVVFAEDKIVVTRATKAAAKKVG